MMKRSALALVGALMLGACAVTPAPEFGPDGQPIPVAYTISSREAAQIGPRVEAQVNQLRTQSGIGPLALDPALTNAALAHARDMAAQNRAWHFGSDGSSPAERARNAGYHGALIGEAISESYENDTVTLNAWMHARDTRDIIMDPQARLLGISWYQEPSRKIWWVLLTGT